MYKLFIILSIPIVSAGLWFITESSGFFPGLGFILVLFFLLFVFLGFVLWNNSLNSKIENNNQVDNNSEVVQ